MEETGEKKLPRGRRGGRRVRRQQTSQLLTKKRSDAKDMLVQLFNDSRPNDRQNRVIECLSTEFFPTAPDPFKLFLELLSLPSCQLFEFPANDTLEFAIVKGFAAWFQHSETKQRSYVFSQFLHKPITAACLNGANIPSMCRLINYLYIQNRFPPELCLIPTLIHGDQERVENYLKHYARRKQSIRKIKLLLKLDEKGLAELCRKCKAPVELDCETFAEYVARSLKKFPESELELEQPAESQEKEAEDEPQVQPPKTKLEELWDALPSRKGRKRPNRLINKLSKDSFPNAPDPFQLCLELMSIDSWNDFTFPSDSSCGMALLEGFGNWFDSQTDRTKVFGQFMQKPIIAACESGNFVSLCQLITFLHLQPRFTCMQCLIPTLFNQGNSPLVVKYLNGCPKVLCKRIISRIDNLLELKARQLKGFAKGYIGSVTFTRETLAECLAFYKEKFRLSDDIVPNLVAWKAKTKEVVSKQEEAPQADHLPPPPTPSQLSSEDPWGNLSPPQRRIERYKMMNDLV